MDIDFDPPIHRVPPSASSRWILVTLGAMVLGGLATFILLRPSASPPPPEIADDPLLVQGRIVYLDRCASCHGLLGRGDGPTAKNIVNPSVGDLTIDRWKHGDKPEQVIEVIRMGVKDTQMPAWGRLISNESVESVTAYVYYLSGREVPATLRSK